MSSPRLGIDQGTTGTKAVLLWSDGRHETVFTRRHRQFHPGPGRVEHDPEELLAAIADGIAAATAVAMPEAIGIANQGETVIAFDAETGRAIHPAIVWMDGRAEPFLDRLRAEGAEAESLARSGLPLDAYFSAGKLRWLLDEVPEARTLAAQGRLRLGTSDAFFLFRLTGQFATDLSTASRTGLLNLAAEEWDDTLCTLYGLPREALPTIRATTDDFGATAEGVPIRGAVVDQQAALYGHGCLESGQLKFTFGTGGFALANTGATPLRDTAGGLVTTIAWKRDGETRYALDGGLYHAASAVDWARGLGLFEDHAEIADFDGPSALSRGLVFIPALTGLACPHWDRSARGAFLGLGIETTRRDMAQAVLEGVALRGAEVMQAMDRCLPLAGAVSIDGGLSRNPYFCRFLASLLGRPVGVYEGEAAAIGAALLAGPMTAAEPRVLKRTYDPGPAIPAEDRAWFSKGLDRSRNWA